MGRKIRIRCPLCGMLVWQSRMNKDHSFEFVIQESRGKGYKQIEHKYRSAYIADTDPSKIFQIMLALKMVEKAKELLEQTDTDITIEINVPDETGEELTEVYEDVISESEAEEVEFEKTEDETIYEVEVGGYEYEIEVPTLHPEDVEKAGILKRLMNRMHRRRIKEMEAIGELEHDVQDIEYEIERRVDYEGQNGDSY